MVRTVVAPNHSDSDLRHCMNGARVHHACVEAADDFSHC